MGSTADPGVIRGRVPTEKHRQLAISSEYPPIIYIPLEITSGIMDPGTLENVVKGLEACGIILGASAVLTAANLGVSICLIKYFERRDLVDLLMPAYTNGHLTQRPNTFNIYEMTDPKTAHLYQNEPSRISR